MTLFAITRNLCDIARVTNLEQKSVSCSRHQIVTKTATIGMESSASSKKALRRLKNNGCSKRSRELKKRNHKLVIALSEAFVDKFKSMPRDGVVAEAYSAMSRIHKAMTETVKRTNISLADLENMPEEADSLDLFPTIDFGEPFDFDLIPAL